MNKLKPQIMKSMNYTDAYNCGKKDALNNYNYDNKFYLYENYIAELGYKQGYEDYKNKSMNRV